MCFIHTPTSPMVFLPESSHTWKPLQGALKKRLRHLNMTERRKREIILKHLAQELLSAEECLKFKQTLQHFRISRSVPSLCTQLQEVITSTDKLMLLLEISSRLPRQYHQDFQKLCTIQFPMYESFLKYFTDQCSFRSDPKVIARDETGQFQVISTGFEKRFSFSDLRMCLDGADENSLPGTSMTSGVYSEIDDTSVNGTVKKQDAQRFTSSQQVNNNNNNNDANCVNRDVSSNCSPHCSTSSSSQTGRKEGTCENHKSQTETFSQNDIIEKESVSKNVVHRQPPVSSLSRSFSGHTLSNGLKAHFSSDHHIALNVESPAHHRIRRTVLLRRRDDGSLGIGIKGGKEYGTPITVFIVEKDSQAQKEGLRSGDRILEVNGTDFTNLTHTDAVLLMRKAWNVIISIEAASQQDPAAVESNVKQFDIHVIPSSGRLGCAVSRDTETGDIMVKSVEEQSAAAKAGMLQGDSIIQIDGIPVHTMTEKQISTLTNSKRVRIQIRRTDKETVSKKNSRTETISSVSDEVFSPLEKSSPNVNEDSFFFAASTPRANILSLDNKEPIKTVSSNLANRNSSHRMKWMNDDFDPLEIFSKNGGTLNRNGEITPSARLYKPRRFRSEQLDRDLEQGRGFHRNTSQFRSARQLGHSAKMAMVYHAKMPADGRASFNERSRSATHYKKWRREKERSRSQSPNALSRLKSQNNMTAEDRVVLHAVNCGMEKRQRALRLSMYQIPDIDDDDWKI